jgi:GH24 family phage-related lysozyme (muramidase)
MVKNKFNSYSENVRLVLFDMMFNLGMGKLKIVFIKFNKLIKENDFKKSALECKRGKNGAKSNLYI